MESNHALLLKNSIRRIFSTSCRAGMILWIVFCFGPETKAQISPSSRLELIRARGLITAGISYEIMGFSMPNRLGEWEGIDVDFIRCVCVALFGNKEHVRFIQVTPALQFSALSSGKIDILATSLPRNFYAPLLPSVTFLPPIFYDTNGFLVPSNLGIRSPIQIIGLKVCVADVPELLEGMLTFFINNNMPLSSQVKGTLYSASKNFINGQCEAFFARRSQLLGFLEMLNATDLKYGFLDLSMPISQLAPSVMAGDYEWVHLLYCVRNALILAEKLGITAENINRLQASQSSQYLLFKQTTHLWGSPLSLSEDWACKVIAAMGNYRQIYRRSFASFKKWSLEEGLNRLLEEGGRIQEEWPSRDLFSENSKGVN